MAEPMRDADAFGQRPRPPIGLVAANAGEQAGEGDVVGNRERRQQVEELKDEADLLAAHVRELVISELGQVATVQDQPARRRAIHRAAHVEEGRLAAAGRAHEGDEIARIDRERHPGQRANRRVAARVGFFEILRR